MLELAPRRCFPAASQPLEFLCVEHEVVLKRIALEVKVLPVSLVSRQNAASSRGVNSQLVLLAVLVREGKRSESRGRRVVLGGGGFHDDFRHFGGELLGRFGRAGAGVGHFVDGGNDSLG